MPGSGILPCLRPAFWHRLRAWVNKALECQPLGGYRVRKRGVSREMLGGEVNENAGKAAAIAAIFFAAGILSASPVVAKPAARCQAGAVVSNAVQEAHGFAARSAQTERFLTLDSFVSGRKSIVNIDELRSRLLGRMSAGQRALFLKETGERDRAEAHKGEFAQPGSGDASGSPGDASASSGDAPAENSFDIGRSRHDASSGDASSGEASYGDAPVPDAASRKGAFVETHYD